MSILDKIETYNTNIKVKNEFDSRKYLSCSAIPGDIVDKPLTNTNTIYESSLLLRVRYSVPDDAPPKTQVKLFREASSRANKKIIYFLYEEVLRDLEHIRDAIYMGSVVDAFAACDELEKHIKE
jgi:hypothetical protein